MIDQTGFQLSFDSLARLADRRRVDLIYLFPENMSGKRNIHKFLDQDHSPLDSALGTRAWRERVTPVLGTELSDEVSDHIGRPIVEIFEAQLMTLGYQDIRRLGAEVLIRNRRNVPLYYLVFASKHALGQKFWDAVRRIDPHGQGSLFAL